MFDTLVLKEGVFEVTRGMCRVMANRRMTRVTLLII